MAEQAATTVEAPAPAPAAPSPINDIAGWITDREQKAAEAKPATPAPAAEPPQEASWWENGLANTSHGFLKNKKGEEVEKAFRYTEQAKQKAETRAKELERELREREADAAALRVQQAQRAPEAPTPATAGEAEDPRFAEVERLWYTDNKRAAELLRQISKDDAEATTRRIISEEREAVAQQQRTQTVMSAAHDAVNQLVARGVDKEIAQKRIMGTFVHVQAYADQTGNFAVWEAPASYLSVYEQLHGPLGEAAPAPAAPALPTVPQRHDPPGSSRPAPPPVVQASAVTPLSSEHAAARRAIAEELAGHGFKFDADRFVKRGAR